MQGQGHPSQGGDPGEEGSNSWTPRPSPARCRVAFSGLPTEIAKDCESELAEAGVAVFSNAASHRMRDDVPLLIPEVNPEHLDLIKEQTTFENGGFIVTNANCSTTGLALPLKAMDDAFGLRFVCVSTYQAVSGAGYPGRAVAGHPGQRRPLHQERGGEDGGGDAQDARQDDRRKVSSTPPSTWWPPAPASRSSTATLESVVLRMEKTPSVRGDHRHLEGLPAGAAEAATAHRPHPADHRPHGGRPAPAALRRQRRRAGPGQRAWRSPSAG